jgi:hypothetical protein
VLVLPGVAPQRVTVFPLTDPLAMRDYVVLGSSAGCLVTADARGALWMANPVTGEQSKLSAITTILFLCPLHYGSTFCLDATGSSGRRHEHAAPAAGLQRASRRGSTARCHLQRRAG